MSLGLVCVLRHRPKNRIPRSKESQFPAGEVWLFPQRHVGEWGRTPAGGTMTSFIAKNWLVWIFSASLAAMEGSADDSIADSTMAWLGVVSPGEPVGSDWGNVNAWVRLLARLVPAPPYTRW